MIDARIEKPRVRLAAGSLVATTDGLLRASGVATSGSRRRACARRSAKSLLARLSAPGTIEVAGPSAAADVRAVERRDARAAAPSRC